MRPPPSLVRPLRTGCQATAPADCDSAKGCAVPELRTQRHSVPIVLVVVVIAVIARLTDAREAGVAVRVAADVPGDLRMRAKWAGELDDARSSIVSGVLRADQLPGRESMFHPGLESHLDVMKRIAHRWLLPGALSEDAGSGARRVAVPHSRDHEEPIELLRLLQTARLLDDGLVVLGTVGRLQRLVLPTVILDDLDALTPRCREVGVGRIAEKADLEVRIRHVAVEIEGLVVPVRILERQVCKVPPSETCGIEVRDEPGPLPFRAHRESGEDLLAGARIGRAGIDLPQRGQLGGRQA